MRINHYNNYILNCSKQDTNGKTGSNEPFLAVSVFLVVKI